MKDDFEKDLDSLLEKIEEEIEVDDEFIPRAVNTLHSMPNIHDYCNMDIVFLNGDVVVFSGSPDLPIVIPSINIIVTSRPYVLGDLKADLEFVSVEEKENPSWSSILSTYGQDHVI